MSLRPEQHDELAELLTAMSDTGLGPPQARRLAELMRDDPAVKQLYLDFVELHTMLVWQHKEGKEERGTRSEERGLGTSVPSGAGIILPIPDLPALHSSFLIPPSTSLSSFVGGAVFSYLIAAVIVSVGLLIAWAWKLPDRTQFARQSVSSPLPLAPNLSFRMEFVGRITGMVDCDFADASTVTFAGSNVPLGRKYALASGLMEITYDTGAKVILQGPCTYEVESAAGGYLSVGKLTARVEKKEERRTKNEELSVSSSSLLIPHSYFAVRTPTATVTDLGTEFGVEVGERGTTTSHVFRGSVNLQVAAIDSNSDGGGMILRENESARVTPSVAGQALSVVAIQRMDATPERFVRRISPEHVADEGVLPVKVVAWYRLGEDDPDATPGNALRAESSNHNGYYHLTPRTKLMYSADAAPTGSSLSVRFDGADNQCLVNSHVPYGIARDFVLEAWVCANKIEKHFQFIAYNGDPNRNGYGLLVGDGRWQFLLGRKRMVDSGVPCELGEWTHLALVCQENHAQLWVNGRPAGVAFPGLPNWPDTSFSIGCDHVNNPALSFNGEIDEVRLSRLLGPFRPEMLLCTPKAATEEKASAVAAPAVTARGNAPLIAPSDPRNVARSATATASSGRVPVERAIDGNVPDGVPGTAGFDDDLDFIFLDNSEPYTLDVTWTTPQYLTSLQTYVSQGDQRDADRAVSSVVFYVDQGSGFTAVGTVETTNSNDIGVFDLTKLDGDWSNVAAVRYEFTNSGDSLGPRVAEVLAIGSADPVRVEKGLSK